jgi:dTDP-glucose pyrophosphorylase
MVATVVNLSYAVQRALDALAQACIIGERFIASRQSASENSYGQDLCLEERIL